MKFGYARCSTLDQNMDWQIDALTKEGATGRMGGRPGKDKKIVEQALTLYDSKANNLNHD